MKKYTLGIGMLVISALILFQNYLPKGSVSLWKLLWLLIVVVGLVESISKKHLYRLFFFGICLFILANQHYQFINAQVHMIITGAIFACIGCVILLRSKDGKMKWFNGSYKVSGDAVIEDSHDIAFGSSTRYIHETQFVRDEVDVAFGEAIIYFDHAIMAGEKATFVVDAAFSTVRLYVPETWAVQVQVDKAFSTVRQAAGMTPSDNVLVVKADLAFSTLVIEQS